MREGFNRIILSGSVETAPEFSHSVLGEALYKLKLSAARLSGTLDSLPVTLPERLLGAMRPEDILAGDRIEITGQVRSYNRRDDTGSHLVITVFARALRPIGDSADLNQAELEGYLVKPAVYRMTPFSREIADVLIDVPRGISKSDLLPCIAWGRNARFSETIEPGSRVLIRGRLQSRAYQKVTDEGAFDRTAYEISCSSIEKRG